MPKFISVFFVFISLFSIAQTNKIDNPIPFDTANRVFHYTDVVSLPDNMAKTILTNAYSWSLNEFGASQFLDSLNSTVFNKGSFFVAPSMRISGVDIVYNYDILFDIIIQAKDGRYKYEFTNIKLSNSSEGMGSDLAIDAYIKQAENYPKLGGKKFIELSENTLILIDTGFKKVISKMKQEISTPSSSDW